MKEKKLQVFVGIVENYFNQFQKTDLLVDTPYLLENEQPQVREYTGVIGISGNKKGVVYVTATEKMLREVLISMDETELSDELLIDLVGEIANTISGNARTEFGPDFHISVPFVFKGVPQSVILPKNERSFIIPVTWQSQEGEIVICLQD